MNKQVTDHLNHLVSDFMVLYMKLHNYHWFIEGIHFYALHQKFEEFYNEVTDYLDEIAERIIMIGGKPTGTLRDCLEITNIREAKGNENEKQMIVTLIQDFQLISREIIEGIKLAQDDSDEVTNDILVKIKSSLDKHNWMLTASYK